MVQIKAQTTPTVSVANVFFLIPVHLAIGALYDRPKNWSMKKLLIFFLWKFFSRSNYSCNSDVGQLAKLIQRIRTSILHSNEIDINQAWMSFQIVWLSGKLQFQPRYTPCFHTLAIQAKKKKCSKVNGRRFSAKPRLSIWIDFNAANL